MPSKVTKTLKVACFPDGSRTVIAYRQGAYWWSRSEGSYPFAAAKESILAKGGWIEVVPNPNYRAKTLFG